MLSPVIRLMFQQMFTILQENDPTEDDILPVLFLLDEFASLGKMDEMSRAITTVRSSGAHLMLIVQSLANLRLNYGADGAANFLGNCELQLFMAPTDTETPEYISKAIGDYTRKARVKTWRQVGFDSASIQERQEGAPLIRPEQLRLLGSDAVIALVRDRNPILASKVRYFEDRHLKRLFDAQTGPLPEPAPLADAADAMAQSAASEIPAVDQKLPEARRPRRRRNERPRSPRPYRERPLRSTSGWTGYSASKAACESASPLPRRPIAGRPN